MAIKDYISVSYLFENDNGFSTNANNYFNILISPMMNVGFTRVTCNLQYQIKGMAISERTKIDSITIDQNNYWNKGSKNNYKGRFELGDLPASYKGRNIEIIWWLYLEVELNSESKSEIQNSLLKDIFVVSFFKSFDGKHQNKNSVIVKNPDYAYEINSFEKTYQTNSITYLIIGLFVTIITTLFFFDEKLKKYILIPTLASISLTGFGLYKLNSIGLLKEVKFIGTPINTETFNLEINIKKNYSKIASATIYYSIIEKVIDNRGTTSKTYKQSIYNSEKKTINNPSTKILNIELAYPSKDIPIDFSRKNISFYSQIEVEFNFTNNTKGTIKQEFPLCKLT